VASGTSTVAAPAAGGQPSEENRRAAERGHGDGPYGPGSAPANDAGSAPDGFDIKGNADSMLYHAPGSRFYEQTVAEVWFDSAESAEAAGFQLPPSQRDDDDGDESSETKDTESN
jgi:large subunit ribosomal protein L17